MARNWAGEQPVVAYFRVSTERQELSGPELDGLSNRAAIGCKVFEVALPYLEDQVFAQCWAHYGPLTQFDTPQRLMADLT